MDVAVTFLFISSNFLSIKCDKPSRIVFPPSELVSTNKISNSSLKLALRYGFHQTSECKDFNKAYICVQKCTDLRYDIAYSDKYCFCTCYVKKQKAKYTYPSFFTKTKWKQGPPVTKKPVWAVEKQKLVEVATLSVATTNNVHEDDLDNGTSTVADYETSIKALNYTENIDEMSNVTLTKNDDLPITSTSMVENSTEIEHSTVDSNSTLDSLNSIPDSSDSATGVTLSSDNVTGTDIQTKVTDPA